MKVPVNLLTVRELQGKEHSKSGAGSHLNLTPIRKSKIKNQLHLSSAALFHGTLNYVAKRKLLVLEKFWRVAAEQT